MKPPVANDRNCLGLSDGCPRVDASSAHTGRRADVGQAPGEETAGPTEV